MPKRRARIVCHRCGIVLTRDESEHYLYQCTTCDTREHHLAALVATDPDHPDLDWLAGSPIDLTPPDRRKAKPGV